MKGRVLAVLLASSGASSLTHSVEMGRRGFPENAITLTGGEKGTKNHKVRTIPITGALQDFVLKLKERPQPKYSDFVSVINDAKKCLQTTRKKLQFPQFPHHDFPAFLRDDLY